MITPDTPPVRDSGTRRTYVDGAQRDGAPLRGRMELLSPYALLAVANIAEQGAQKYAERNWERGIKLSSFIQSALRHTTQLLAGDETEDHAAQAAWNLMAYIHTRVLISKGLLPESYDDMPHYETRTADNFATYLKDIGQTAPESPTSTSTPDTGNIITSTSFLPTPVVGTSSAP